MLTTQDLRSLASQKGIKIIGITNQKLHEELDIPEAGDTVKFVKSKGHVETIATFKRAFKCKKTGKFYAVLKDAEGNRMIKQILKIEKVKS